MTEIKFARIKYIALAKIAVKCPYYTYNNGVCPC